MSFTQRLKDRMADAGSRWGHRRARPTPKPKHREAINHHVYDAEAWMAAREIRSIDSFMNDLFVGDGSEERDGFDNAYELIKALWLAFYKSNPTLARKNELEKDMWIVQRMIEQIMENPEFERIHDMTSMDPAMSTMAVESFYEHLKEILKRNQELAQDSNERKREQNDGQRQKKPGDETAKQKRDKQEQKKKEQQKKDDEANADEGDEAEDGESGESDEQGQPGGEDGDQEGEGKGEGEGQPGQGQGQPGDEGQGGEDGEGGSDADADADQQGGQDGPTPDKDGDGKPAEKREAQKHTGENAEDEGDTDEDDTSDDTSDDGDDDTGDDAGDGDEGDEESDEDSDERSDQAGSGDGDGEADDAAEGSDAEGGGGGDGGAELTQEELAQVEADWEEALELNAEWDDERNLEDALDKSSIDRLINRALEEGADEIEALDAARRNVGLEDGQWGQMSADERLRIAEILRSPEMRELAEIVGRMRRFAMGARANRINDVPHEAYDVELGNEINRVLKSQFAFLATPETAPEFYRRYAERELLQFKMRGTEEAGKGPIIVCIDKSYSMSGSPFNWAMAVAEALRRICHEQDRDYVAIFFGTNNDRHSFEFPKGATDFNKVLEFLQAVANGGTEFDGVLQDALSRVTEQYHEGMERADIVFITDGQAHLSEEWLERFNKEKEEVGCRVYGVFIGGASDYYNTTSTATKILDSFSDVTIPVSDLTGDSVRDIFTHV